jgi:hypothetical protein
VQEPFFSHSRSQSMPVRRSGCWPLTCERAYSWNDALIKPANGHTLGTSLFSPGLYSEVCRIRERNGLCSQFSYNYFLDNIASCQKSRCKLQQNFLVYHRFSVLFRLFNCGPTQLVCLRTLKDLNARQVNMKTRLMSHIMQHITWL